MQNLYLNHLLKLYIKDYLVTNGEPKVLGQEVIINRDLKFSASCCLNQNNGPLLEFSLGLGYTIAKSCFTFIKQLFGKDIIEYILPPFNEDILELEYFEKYKNDIHILDLALVNTLEKIRKENLEAFDYWTRLFEYSLGFIMLHELGHFINGHCQYFNQYNKIAYKINKEIRKELHTAELQSDIFATQIILNAKMFYDLRITYGNEEIPSFKEVGDAKWIECINFSIFLVFIILENVDSKQKISTHPKAIIRILNSLKHILAYYQFYKIVDNQYAAINYCKDLLEKLTSFSNSLNIETSSWIDSLQYLWYGDMGTIPQNSDISSLIELQEFSKVFRYKIGRYSNDALHQLNTGDSLKDIMGLIALSGNHIPWNWINSDQFYDIAFENISFYDTRIRSFISNSKREEFNTYRLEYNELIDKQLKKVEMELKNVENEIARFLNYSNEDLFSEIGIQLIASNVIRLAPDEEKIDEIRSGKIWYEKYKEILQKKICFSNMYILFSKNKEKYDKVILCASIADLISGICVGVSPIVVAVLVLNLGLTEFCKNVNYVD